MVDPTYLDPWSVLLLALQREDRVDEGLADVRALVEGGDDDIALGIAQQLAAAEPVLAIMVYDTILEVEPDLAVALAYRGWLVHLAGLDEEAIGYLDRAVAADPDLSDAHAFRAIVLEDLGRIDEARAALAAFDATDPPPGMTALIDQSGLRDRLE
jgi:tetratricopeptide (TPR) repeat protein